MPGWIETRPNGRYRARFPTPGGGTVSRTFPLRRDAKEWLNEQEADARHGTWVDPRKAKRPFGEWATKWQADQVQHRPTTAETTERRLRVHILPAFGDTPIGGITRTGVQAWVKKLSADGLAPRTVRGIYHLLATILRAAAEDRLIPLSPCRRINLPEVIQETVTVPSLAELELIATYLPRWYRRIVAVIAGTGMRQGEVRGLTVDRIDFLRRSVRVDRQMVTIGTGSGHGPPKRPASVRTIPLGQHTLDVLAAQIAEFPPGRSGLVFRSRHGGPLSRTVLNQAWRRAALDADVEWCTPHSGRDFYASLLIRQGLSPKVVAVRLGHKDGGVEVLRTYAHLWPDDEDRTRAAVDEVLAPTPARLGTRAESGAKGPRS